MKDGEWIRINYINYAIEVFIEKRDLPRIAEFGWLGKQTMAKSLLEVETYPRDYIKFESKSDPGDIEVGRFGTSCKSIGMIEKADRLMMEKHEGQRYGAYPYHTHLRGVKKIATEEFKLCFSEDELIPLSCSCLLHDIIEDSNVTCEFLNRIFGKEIASVVYAVTNERGMTPFHRIKKLKLATATKLADRIYNLRGVIDNPKLGKLISKYKNVHSRFCYELCETSKWGSDSDLKTMWAKYAELIGQLPTFDK